MPEEKKKESFTFSDKIKDSKSNKAASKSFAKRISSRIGRDGKPRQTIFERTKRDAPFLIAALIALLLLPFLYKYSGSVKEETVLTPSSTETVFDPERYAFAPDIEDPEGQISQLSGRDSLSLIKGFGSDSEEDEYGSSDEYDYNAEAYAQRDAYKESASAKKLKADTNIDIEENTTNIYKKRARAGTRAAFKRAATKINTLPGGSRARTSGSPLGVGKWGGSLKGAAKKVKGDGNKNSPKPVSLQPLQAAGKPSRSAFGNPAAALRQSKDALGKGDAKQAILDAQMKPVEPGSFGGMTLGDAKFGGGSGNFDRKFNYQGKEPWWWDLMKTRSQALWQRKMQRKWNWEDWLDKWAQNILGKLMNCLITGSDEGDVDGFLYKKEGDGKEALCCGKKRAVAEPLLKQLGVEFGKDGCKSLQLSLGKDKCKEAWEDGKEAKADMNFFQVRGACLGLAVGSKYGKGEPSLSVDCSDLDTGAHRYVVSHNGKARKWEKNTYIYVVARNYVPFPFRSLDRAEAYEKNKEIGGKGIDPSRSEMVGEMYANLKEKELTGLRLCSVFGNNLRATDKSVAGTAAIYTTTTEMLAEKYDLSGKDKAYLREMERAAAKETNNLSPYEEPYGEPVPQMPERLYKEMKNYAVAHAGSIYKSANATWARAEEFDPESLDDACVIYQAKGISLDWEKHFKPQVIALLEKMLKDRELASGKEYQTAVDMFNDLDLMFVGSMSSEHQLAHRRDVLDNEILPMPFWEFKAAYLDRYGVTAKHKDSGNRSYIGNGKYRMEGEDTVYSEKCYFHNSVRISCEDNVSPMTATVTFSGESYKGAHAGKYYPQGVSHMQKDLNFTEEKKNIRVTAEFTPLDGSFSGVEQTFYNPELAADKGNQLVYTFSHIVGVTTGEKGKEVKEENPAVGRVTWKLFRGSNPEAIDSATCEIGLAGDGEIEHQSIQSSLNAPGSGTPTNVPTDNNNSNSVSTQRDFLEGCKDFGQNQLLIQEPKEDALTYIRAVDAFATKSAKDLTVMDVVNAIYMNKNDRVPGNLVCVLGKTIGAYSVDPTAKDNSTCGRPFDNVFGSFLAFMGLDAASFPSEFTHDPCDKGVINNLRFLDCTADSNSLYWWGGYVDDNVRVTDKYADADRNSYFEDRDKGRVWDENGKFPLAGLIKEKFPTTGDGKLAAPSQEEVNRVLNIPGERKTTENYYRVKFHDMYASLEDGDVECDYDGVTLSKEDVLKYIDILCKNGHSIKPMAWLTCSEYNARFARKQQQITTQRRSSSKVSKKNTSKKKVKRKARRSGKSSKGSSSKRKSKQQKGNPSCSPQTNRAVGESNSNPC